MAIGDSAVQVESFEILLREAGFHVLSPMPTQTARACAGIDLDVMQQWRVGDTVLAAQQLGIVDSDISGARGFGGINLR